MSIFLLAVANTKSPLFWAVMLGWILSVTLHEFAHGLVAYLGGDYTIRDRGLLTLNPLKYAHPVMTFLLPLVWMLMGGVPLMGGATYINVSLLRSRAWRSASSAAGPAANLILFFVCAIPLHPRFHWIDLNGDTSSWTSLQMFCATMAVLQLVAVFINLMPIPPLDGFHVIEPYLPSDLQAKLRNPQFNMVGLLVIFFLLQSPQLVQMQYDVIWKILQFLRFDDGTQEFIRRSYNMALFGSSD